MSIYYDNKPPNNSNMHFRDSHHKSSSSILSSSSPITLKVRTYICYYSSFPSVPGFFITPLLITFSYLCLIFSV